MELPTWIDKFSLPRMTVLPDMLYEDKIFAPLIHKIHGKLFCLCLTLLSGMKEFTACIRHG